MTHRILIIDGHPDPNESHFVHQLAKYYQQGTEEGGHKARLIRVGALQYPLLRSRAEFVSGKTPAAIVAAQKSIKWADHLVVLYPLWFGSMPAVLKGFLEQVLRPGFAFPKRQFVRPNKLPLAGRSARIVVTTGLPGLFGGQVRLASDYRSVARNVLEYCGIEPARTTVIANVEHMTTAQSDNAFYTMRRLGALAK